jgi:exodeoxyribonuclease-3
MKLVTWNVNGIRAREAGVISLLRGEQPDVLCLQELKALPAQIPASLRDNDDYWSYWHGSKGYSGVSLHVRKTHCPEQPRFWHPDFDTETRIVIAEVHHLSIASLYVPNGGRDYQAKLGFLHALEAFARASRQLERQLVICGDINIARHEVDVHPKLRDPRVIGQRPEERDLFASLLEKGDLRDIGRELDPENEELFTWWPPWRSMRQRNIGWRLDYMLARSTVASKARRARVERQATTSDHGPLVIEIESP